MPRSSDMGNFRPAKSHAKPPPKDALARLADSELSYPRAPAILNGDKVARQHFDHLIRSFAIRTAQNGFVQDCATSAAQLWSRSQAIFVGLGDDAAENRESLIAMKGLNQLYSARVCEARRAARQDAVRLRPAAPAPSLATVHALDRGLGALIARAPKPQE